VTYAHGRDESPEQRADRNWNELLQELRVTETGVQVLFSVLLTVPFSARFDRATDLQRGVYFAALLLTAASSVTLIAPVAYHRLLFAKGEKPRLVRQSSRLALAGLLLLVLAVVAVLLLVTDVLFEGLVATVVAALFGLATLALWFGPPVAQRLRDR
jgi:cobalamin synthase